MFCVLLIFLAFPLITDSFVLLIKISVYMKWACNHDNQPARIKFVSNLHYNSIQNERIMNVTHVN